MYCVNCGIELADNAKFCSSCGNNLSSVPPLPLKRDWDFHVSILGWLVIAHAALIGLIGLDRDVWRPVCEATDPGQPPLVGSRTPQ